jgi:hypothetical protein
MAFAPVPTSPEEQARWIESGMRYDILCGHWAEWAEQRHADLFAEEIRTFLPPAEVSRNPALNYHSQLAIVYDQNPTVTATEEGVEIDADDLAAIVTDELWQVEQQNGLLTSGCNEALIRLDVDPEADPDHVHYRCVPAHRVEAWADPSDPSNPWGIRELRPRTDPVTNLEEWTWEEWDVSTPTPTFRITAKDANGNEQNVTEKYAGSAEFPYIDDEGPIFPYVLYHRQHTRQLWSPFTGSELFSGTLTVSALWTLWLSGVRDGAHPLRVVLNGTVVGGKVVKQLGGGGGSAPIEQAVVNPMALLQIHDVKQGQSASIGQWQPAMDPKSAAESIESYEAGLGTYAGVSPADLSRGSASASGYSIIVSRDGQRKAVQRMIPGRRVGDARLLATAARLANRYLGTSLPTSRGAYSIQYHTLPETTEERAAKLSEAKELLALGLMSKVEAYMLFHPGVKEDAAEAALAKIAGRPTIEPPDPPDAPPAVDEDSPAPDPES